MYATNLIRKPEAPARHRQSSFRAVVFSLVIASALWTGTGSGAAPATASPSLQLDRSRFMGVDELKPGMTGYGLSVFSGTTVDTFQVEIVGVRHNYFPQSDMILARGSGQGLEKAGIAAGMSGSPIFIEGRLVGALAYGWPFMISPIMGITPIESMLELKSVAGLPIEPAGGSSPASSSESRAAWRSLLASRGGEEARKALSLLNGPEPVAASGEVTPIAAPLFLSGFDERAASGLGEWLSPRGLNPVMAGGGSSTGSASGVSGNDLVPGSAVGVQLVRGDATASAIGTVTWRDGNRILAFGHPLFHKGRTAYPMTTATIETVMPRLNDSFKFGSAAEVVGTVDVDLRSGISGVIGPAPSMIPVEVRVEDELARSAQTFHYEVAEDQDLTGPFTAWVASNSLLTHGKEMGDATIEIGTRLKLRDGRSLDMHNALAASYLPGTVALEVARPIGLLLSNPLEKVALAAVEVDLKIRQHLDVLNLEEVVLDNPTPRAGEPLAFRATFRNYRGATLTERYSLPVPPDLKGGTYKLRVSDAAEAQAWDAKRAPGLYDPQSVDQILKLLGSEKPLNTLVLSLVDSRPGVSASGEELGPLPPSVMAALASRGVEGKYALTQGNVLARKDQTMEGMVQGSIEMDVKVVDDPRGVRAPEEKR